MAIEAWIWRNEQSQRRQVAQAWHTAVLTRAKKLPGLKQYLNAGPAKPLAGRELQRRREEFQEMTAGIDLAAITKGLKKESNQ